MTTSDAIEDASIHQKLGSIITSLKRLHDRLDERTGSRAAATLAPYTPFPESYTRGWAAMPAGLDFVSLDVYNRGAIEVKVARQHYGHYLLPLLKPSRPFVVCPAEAASSSASWRSSASTSACGRSAP